MHPKFWSILIFLSDCRLYNMMAFVWHISYSVISLAVLQIEMPLHQCPAALSALHIFKVTHFNWVPPTVGNVFCAFQPCSGNSTRERSAYPIRQPGERKECPPTEETEICKLNSNCFHYSYNITGEDKMSLTRHSNDARH